LRIAEARSVALDDPRVRLQIKFNRALKRELAPGDRRLWLLRAIALRIERHRDPLWVFEVFHRRLILVLGTLAVAVYLFVATALFVWLDRQPHNQVGWFDIAAPWHWDELRAKRGDTAVQAGLADLRERNYSDAFYQLRVGLARSPGNIEGRLTLAQLFAGHDQNQALSLLEGGLAYSPNDKRLISGLLEFYGLMQIQDRALATVEQLLASKPDGEILFLLQRARVALLLQMKRYPEAETALAAIAAPATAADQAGVQALRIELLLRSGRAAEARDLVEGLLVDGVPSAVLRQGGEVAVALGDADLLQRVLRRLRAAEPEAPGAYLYAIQSWHQLNRLSLRDAAERDYFQLFRANEAALQAVAALAVNLDLPDLVNRARLVATASRFSQFAYRVHLTEIALRKGDTGLAMRSLREWETSIGTLKAQQRFYPEFILRLTRASFIGTPDQVTSLLGHLSDNRLQARVQVFDLAYTVLEKAGHVAAASQLAQAGLQLYPYAAPLLAASQRFKEQLAAATLAASAPAAHSQLEIPGNGSLAMQQLDRLLAADELGSARDLIRAVRAQKPAWLVNFEGELGARDVELSFLALDTIAGRAAARTYLDRHRTDADALRLVQLAGRFAERGRPADARLLYDEIAASPAAQPAVVTALRALSLPDDTAGVTGTQATAVAALDRFIAAADWAQAERLLRQLRDKPPEWIEAGFSEVKVREVLVRFGLDQRPLALTALKDLVVKGGAARSMAFKLVRDLSAREEHEQALVLAREIMKLLPGDAAATRLLREAEAPKPVGG